ncbi:MAG TPA: TrbI/VirB10 family protein [Terriglobales bacterium]|nr:TrbI/VirB10 family protein [Terriglobales bacterium]
MEQGIEPNKANTITDKAPKPSGLLPKNLQAFVVVGLALVMVAIMALTGHKRPVAPTPQANPATPNLLPLNTEKVSEFQKRIEDAQRLSAPQAEAALLQKQKQLAVEGVGPAQPVPSSLNGSPVPSANPAGAYPPGAYASALPQPAESGPASDPIKDEQHKRHYQSLFADNVALTYRKDMRALNRTELPSQTAADPPLAQDQLASQALAELARQSQLLAQAQQTGVVPPNQKTLEPANISPQNPVTTARTGDTRTVPAASDSDSSKKYLLFEGTILETVLINRLDGSFSGSVECLVANDVYSHDRQHLLIPAGSKVLGAATKVDTFGQSRLAVTFHRLIMPDGYSISLDRFTGLDQQGATALKDKVNNHYAKIFGASLALGVLGGISEANTGTLLNATEADRVREGLGSGLGNAGEEVLDRFLNILPTVTIREGARVKVYLSGDLLLPDYHDHNLPPNL